MSDKQRIRAGIERVLTDERTPGVLAAYFEPCGPFAASTFDSLGVEDAGYEPDRLLPVDLLAVTLLDVSVPPRAVRQWLGEQADEIGALLAAIPDVDLWSDDADWALGTAEQLHRLLRQAKGVKWVRAGKLMARKRPRLIPVYDSVVQAWMGAPKQFWRPLRAVLRDEPELVQRIEVLRPADAEPVSTLRLIDAAVWMLGGGGRNARKARSRVKDELARR